MFLVNDKVVYPGYGVALISKLVERFVSGKMTSFYELKFFNKDMSVLIPEDRIEAAGIRKLSSDKYLEEMFKILSEPLKKENYEIGFNNWNKRNKKYQLNLRSGDLLKICHIHKDLEWISKSKDLSFGERNLKTKIEQLLIEEISIVKNIDKEKALKILHKSFVSVSQVTAKKIKSINIDQNESLILPNKTKTKKQEIEANI